SATLLHRRGCAAASGAPAHWCGARRSRGAAAGNRRSRFPARLQCRCPVLVVCSWLAEALQIERAFVYLDSRPAHPYVRTWPAPLNVQASTRQIHGHVVPQQPEALADHSRGTSPRAAGAGFSHATLEDTQSNAVAIHHFHEADIGAAWKAGVILY